MTTHISKPTGFLAPAGFVLCMGLCLNMTVLAQSEPAPMQHHAQADSKHCTGTGLECATAVTPAFDADRKSVV